MNPFLPITYMTKNGTVNHEELMRQCKAVAKHMRYGKPNQMSGYHLENDDRAFKYLTKKINLKFHDSDTINYFVAL